MGADSSQFREITDFDAFLQELRQGIPHQVVVAQFLGVRGDARHFRGFSRRPHGTTLPVALRVFGESGRCGEDSPGIYLINKII